MRRTANFGKFTAPVHELLCARLPTTDERPDDPAPRRNICILVGAGDRNQGDAGSRRGAQRGRGGAETAMTRRRRAPPPSAPSRSKRGWSAAAPSRRVGAWRAAAPTSLSRALWRPTSSRSSDKASRRGDHKRAAWTALGQGVERLSRAQRGHGLEHLGARRRVSPAATGRTGRIASPRLSTRTGRSRSGPGHRPPPGGEGAGPPCPRDPRAGLRRRFRILSDLETSRPRRGCRRPPR